MPRSFTRVLLFVYYFRLILHSSSAIGISLDVIEYEGCVIDDVLSPGHEIFGLRTDVPSEIGIALEDLVYGTDYEIVLSYPATQPSHFVMDIIDVFAMEEAGDLGSSLVQCLRSPGKTAGAARAREGNTLTRRVRRRGSFRMLLDTEKIFVDRINYKDAMQDTRGMHLFVLRVRALPTSSRSIDRRTMSQTTTFNVRIDSLILGLPARVWKMLGFSAGVLAVVLLVLVPTLSKRIQWAVAGMGEGSCERHAKGRKQQEGHSDGAVSAVKSD